MKLEDWKASRLVYSTDAARTAACGRCGEERRPCRCQRPAPPAAPPEKQRVRVSIDRKGRKGKSMTLVEGIVADGAGLEALGRRLKTACGSGGTVKDGRIEIQGEHRERVLELLAQLGYRPKASGG
jgi:translation initiation factor 1